MAQAFLTTAARFFASRGGAALLTAVLGAVLLSMAPHASRAAMTPVTGDPIATTGGKVSGTRLASGVKAYFGMPYAKPPVRELRWQAPQPIRWDGVFNADRKGPECIQVLRPHKINHYFGEEPSSEDCLYLNLWAPADAHAGEKRPVIVFIYGGGGTVGSSGPALYAGEQVAKKGAIFVNFNYRVGILGFMAHPELTKEQGGHSGNYGYLDQNAALRWVHDNIAAFGGDPDKVVITGQSFGAGSVNAQLFSPLSKGLFRAAAMWSGCDFAAAQVPLATGEKTGLEIQKRLGAADLAALRDVPADRILAVQEEHQLGANVTGVRVPPTVDGYFWTADRASVLSAHQLNDVPIIASSNGDDLDSNQSPLTKATTVAEYQEIAGRMFGAAAPAFLKLFPAATDADVSAVAHRAAQDGGFLRRGRNCAILHAQSGTAPSYIDLFDRKHPYVPGVAIADQNIATIGAYHTADVPYWFGTFDAFNLFRPTRNWTADDAALSEVMMGSLLALAETGSPSTPAFQWPAWSPKAEKFAVFGAAAKVQPLDLTRIEWLIAHPAAATPVVNSRGPETRD